MHYCPNCGNTINEGAAFCGSCGNPVATPATSSLVPTVSNTYTEEQEFLDTTHRLLRWEHKAWSICGKVYLIMGIIFAALFFMFGIVFAAMGDYDTEALSFMFIMYAFIYGGMFIGIGIVSKKAAERIPFYLDNLYTNFRYAYDRCGNVGMLVFNAILGTVSPIFFIINFVRMKTNRALIEKILSRQQLS